MSRWIPLALFLSAIPPTLSGQDLAIRGVRAHTMHGPVIEDAVILIDGGLITAIGSDLEIPRGARVIDGRGLDAWPGFIDGWTSLGLVEVDSVRGTVDRSELGDWNSHLRAAAAVNPHASHIPVARVNGITTAAVVPEGGKVGGLVAILDLQGLTVPRMLCETGDPLRVLSLPRAPTPSYVPSEDRQNARKLEDSWKEIEDHFAAARRIGALQAQGVRDVGSDLDGQQRLALLATAVHLEAGAPWLIRVDARQDILAALAFAEKHGLRLVLAGLRDGWSVADRLAASGHRLLVGSPYEQPPKDEPYDAVYANAAALHRAGCRFGFISSSSSTVRNLPYQAAICVAYGLPREAAMRALTLGAAEALGLADTHGTLAAGRTANIVLWEGDPLDARSNPSKLIIRGRDIPLRSRHTELADPYLPHE